MVLILALISLFTIAVGSIVWVRNRQNLLYQSFMAVCFSGSMWILTNAFFPTLQGEIQFVDALVSYAAMGLFATFFVVFTTSLAMRQISTRGVVITGALFSLISALPGVLATEVIDDRIITTPWLVVYAIGLVSCFSLGIIQLLKGLATTSSRRQQQIATVLIGIVITFIGAGICNLLLPLTGDYRFVTLGPAFALVFLLFFSYTIIWHHLFDVRRTIMRVVAYSLSVVFLGATLGYIAYQLYILNARVGSPTIFIATGIVISILFTPTKHLFDKLTYKWLFSSEYDTQQAIDTLTAIMASSRASSQLEQQIIKSLIKILNASTASIMKSMPRSVNEYVRSSKRSVVVRDDLEDSAQNGALYEYLVEQGIALCAPLTVTSGTIGYLCIGDKENGTSYGAHDVEFIDILSDELAIALQNTLRFEEIQVFNAELQNKIHDATSELRDTNKKLRAIDASKDEFISMASHQLRTPLTSIKGYISMLLEGDLGEITPQQRKALEEAYNSSQRMVYLIGDFLNLSRLQTGRFELERTPVSLPHIIAEEIAQLRAAAEARGVTLQYDPPASFPEVLVDENKIRQVMMNFIDNAIYYAKPTGGVITVSLLEHAHHVSFRVRDNGIGVPAHERPHLFMKFYRAANARKARPDGTGIGLYMAKKVIIAHGGTILFESKEGQGSEFGFRLPTKNPSI